MKIPHILIGAIYAAAAEPRLRFAKDDAPPSGAGGAGVREAGGAQAPVQRQRQPAPPDQSSNEAKARRQAEAAASTLREQAARRHAAAIANGTAAPGSEPPATPTADEIASGSITITAEQTREADLERERQVNLLRAMNRTPEQDQQHRFEMEKLEREKQQATGPQAVNPAVMAAPEGSDIPAQPVLAGTSKGTATPPNPAGNPELPIAPAPQPQDMPGDSAEGAQGDTGPQGSQGEGAEQQGRRMSARAEAKGLEEGNSREELVALADAEGVEVKSGATKPEIAAAIVAKRAENSGK